MGRPTPAFPSEYDVVKPLGAGGYGQAYLAKHRPSSELQAIKELRPASASERSQALAEAKHLAELKHPNIIRYIDTLVKGGSVFIVMEYAPHGTLWNKIEECRRQRGATLAEDRVLRWAKQLSQALRFIHHRGLVHRDVKNTNCFLSRDDGVRLGDFGTVRRLEQNHPEVGRRTCMTPVGTPLYISPEICRGAKYTQKTDVWGVGCALYELLSLKHPFFSNSQSRLMDVIKRGQYDKRLPHQYSVPLQRLVHECLAVNPESRPTVKSILGRAKLFGAESKLFEPTDASAAALQAGTNAGERASIEAANAKQSAPTAPPGWACAAPAATAAAETSSSSAGPDRPPQRHGDKSQTPTSMSELSRAATKRRLDAWQRPAGQCTRLGLERQNPTHHRHNAADDPRAHNPTSRQLFPLTQPEPAAAAAAAAARLARHAKSPREAAIIARIRHAPGLGPATGAAVAALAAHDDANRPRVFDSHPNERRRAPLQPLQQLLPHMKRRAKAHRDRFNGVGAVTHRLSVC